MSEKFKLFRAMYWQFLTLFAGYLVILGLCRAGGVSRFRVNGFSVKPIESKKLEGTWYLIKWLPPVGFNPNFREYRYVWEVETDEWNRLLVTSSGRNIQKPFNCNQRSVVPDAILTPMSDKGRMYRWESPAPQSPIPMADVYITDTDYDSYLLLESCLPDRRNCNSFYNVFSRAPFATKRLVQKLDNLIRRKIRLNPRKFFFSQIPNFKDCRNLNLSRQTPAERRGNIL